MHEQYTDVPMEKGQQVSEFMHKEDTPSAHGERSLTPSEHLISLPGACWGLWRWFALRGAGFPVSQVLRLATSACAEATDRFLAYEAEPEQTQQAQQARAELQEQFSKTTMQSMQVLSEVAQTGHFREAVLWQNRGAVRDGIRPFLKKPIVPNPAKRQRTHGQLIAKYLQRYCTKNDTIGFFGPVGWGYWVSDGADITVRPGPQLLETRTVYFETWGIDVLGEMLAQDSALLPWAIPRPMPFLSLSGTTLHVPFVRPLQLSTAQAIILATCDGQRTAREVAQRILQTPRTGLTNEAEVFAILDELRTARRITWTFDVSMEDWHPERALRRQLERITPVSLRQRALGSLDRLDTARVAVAAAAGNEEQLNQALENLEATFADITGKSANREAGKTYAARTLVYEDCRRNLEFTLGPALLAELASPLGLLLASTRWFTYTIARFYRKAFRKKYIELVQKTGSSTIDFATYWSWVQPLFPTVLGQLLTNTLLPEFQKRWAAILNIPAEQSCIHYTSQELQSRVQEIFRAPHSGWRSACYASPDVLIAATSVEAILRGDYELVLGEFHQGTNTLDFIALVAQHPAPSDLMQAVAADHPEPRVVPVFPRHTIPVKRAHTALTLTKDRRLIFSADSAGVPPEQALPLGLLILEECEGELVARTRDGQQQFDLLEIFDSFISAQVCDTFKILAPAPHTPRITVDRLVICRETWRFAPADLAWAFSTDPLKRYIDMRRWAQEQHMPRFFFVRTPNERKPFYVDLDSPIYGDVFAKAIRLAVNAKGERITITEMLPDPAHAWLPDADGNRYTCEMRMVAVDQLKPPRRNTYGTH